MRDVLQVGQTNANSVEWVTLTSWTDAAAPVAESATKPEATGATSTASAPVRTLAVWMPVTEQQLQDVPQIQGLIDNELRSDLRALEERQFLYGSGAGENLQGLLTLGGVPSITRTVTNTTNLDRIRIGMTDVLLAGYEPNAVVMHPLDWEAIVLLKATDNRYIWVVVTDPQTGNSRVWGLTVVETTGAKNPANLQRYLLVGDFRRGATVYDRQQAAVQVGYVNDDFIKNKRTIRAEERLAFAIKRPTAFAKYETATAV
jgi:HK97 family phage major capsid protein